MSAYNASMSNVASLKSNSSDLSSCIVARLLHCVVTATALLRIFSRHKTKTNYSWLGWNTHGTDDNSSRARIQDRSSARCVSPGVTSHALCYNAPGWAVSITKVLTLDTHHNQDGENILEREKVSSSRVAGQRRAADTPAINSKRKLIQFISRGKTLQSVVLYSAAAHKRWSRRLILRCNRSAQK